MNSAELLDINYFLKNMSDLQREFLQLHKKHEHLSFVSMKQQANKNLVQSNLKTSLSAYHANSVKWLNSADPKVPS